ncbi:MAG: hypothetical protein HXS54_01140 [Theionarchaea archaeon]|nr:hypothetical protein [Theionarchaea archaeon]
MFEKQSKLVLADIGTSKTDIAGEPNLNQRHSFSTLVAYDDSGVHIGDNALERAGAADLVWVKDSARLSRQELMRHPTAFTDYVRLSLNRLDVNPPIDLLISEPALMTASARDLIRDQISEITGVSRLYFLPELIATVFSQELTGRFILLDMGDGNTSIQAFNNRAPIQGARQTFRAGRTITYNVAEVLRNQYDIDYDVTSAGSSNYRYMISLKHRLFSKERTVKIIDQDNQIQDIEVTTSLQRRILSCLFDNRQYKPIQDEIVNVAFAVKDLAPDLLSRVYLTGRAFSSQAVTTIFVQEINRLLQEQMKAFGIGKIEIIRLENYAHSVYEGMKVLGKRIQQDSKQWIDLHG